MPTRRSDQVVLEANPAYWDPGRFPRLQRIIFDNTLAPKEALELVKSGEGRVDVVTELPPLETLRVAQSPFAKVVKNRGTLGIFIGLFNMRKTGSRWTDVRLRRAANLAIHREHLIQYAAKGNGVIVPALLPARAFGYDPALAPYPFDPDQGRRLLSAVGYPEGMALTLIAPSDLEVQATVVSKMLEQGGFQVTLQVLDPLAFMQKTLLGHLEHPAEEQSWDIALTEWRDAINFPVMEFYTSFALNGRMDWVLEEPDLRQLYAQVSRTLERADQEPLVRQMERHTHAQAYFLFLYNPIQLFAVNKAVDFVPYVTTLLEFAETAVTEEHWSVRKQGAAVQE
jgi:peptide/nickel transport system substrate-binding protein